jgi:hypothetical protein
MAYSWYTSFPLSVSSVNDSIFNHVPFWYWISLPLLLTSMCMMAISFKNKYWIFAMAVSCVITLYSLFYFYYMMPGSDSHYFRGLTEYSIREQSLDPSQINHRYYQWPSFFILANIVTSVSGLTLANYEFLLFAIISFLMSSALYVYASTSAVYNRGNILAVIIFFVVVFNFLNYQTVPFSLAFAVLFLLLMLETQKKSTGIIVIIVALYSGLVITHAFVPLFFVLYLLIRTIISRSKEYFRLFMLALSLYFLLQITLGQISFAANVINVLSASSEYSSMVSSTLAPVSSSLDIIAQTFSRIVTIAFAMICFTGFILLIIKRRLREIDKAVFLSGVVYSVLGVLLFTLGSRAIPLVFVPISLGILYLYESKIKRYLLCSVLVLLILVVFVPIHFSFDNYPIEFQTKEELTTTNYMLAKYNWASYSVIISDSGMKWYLDGLIKGYSEIDTGLSPRFELSNITNYDCIVYSIGLAMILQRNNISLELTSQQIIAMYNIIYDSGFSYIAKKTN